MKFTITMKDPDGPCDCIDDEAKASLAKVDGIDDHEREELLETRAASMREFAARWMEYGEYVRIEFDTDAGTATVLPRSR